MKAVDPLEGKAFSLRPGVTLQVCHTSGQRPALVFLHGGLGNRFNWRSQYEFAQAQGWEALAYDLAGHGQSSPYHRYSIGRHCRDLWRLLQHLQIVAPVLCCHSYGVPIGLEWARRYSSSGLVLIAGGTHDLYPWWEIPLITFLAGGGRHLSRLPWIQRWIDHVSSPYRHSTVQRFLQESPLPLAPHPYRALTPFWRYNFFRQRQGNREQQVPTLVITGGQDPMFSRQMGQNLAAHFELSQHLHLAAAGHLVMAEQPEVVNGAIARWLSQINPPLTSPWGC